MTHDPQAKFELNDIIDYLVARKFRPDKDEDFPSISRWLTRPATIDSFFDDNQQENLAYKAQPTNMSTEKLTTLLADVNATEDAETKAWAKLQDQTKFFNEPRAQADHDFWSMMPLWDLDEATALSLDKDPRVVDWPNIGPHVNDSPFADQYSKLRLIVLRAKIAGKLSDGVLPGDFVSWAEKTGVDLPTGLKNAGAGCGTADRGSRKHHFRKGESAGRGSESESRVGGRAVEWRVAEAPRAGELDETGPWNGQS